MTEWAPPRTRQRRPELPSRAAVPGCTLLQDLLAYRARRREKQYAAIEAMAADEDDDPAAVLDQLRAARRAVAARRRARS